MSWRRVPSSPLFLGILAIAIISIGIGASLGGTAPGFFGGIIDRITGRSGVTLSITGSLVQGDTVVSTWTEVPTMFSTLTGPNDVGIDPAAGTYLVLWQPLMNLSFSNLKGTNAKLTVEITSVSATWKGSPATVYKTMTSAGWTAYPDTYERTGTVADFQKGFSAYVGSRSFDVQDVINNPPAPGTSSDHKITYSYAVRLWVDGQLVDTKTGTITGTATFRNTGIQPSGQVLLTVTLTPSVVHLPVTVGF